MYIIKNIEILTILYFINDSYRPVFRPEFPYKGKKRVLDISVQGVGRLHLWNVFKNPKYLESSHKNKIQSQKGWICKKDGFVKTRGLYYLKSLFELLFFYSIRNIEKH